MKTYKQITASQVDTVTCDRCGREDEADGMEGQEFLAYDMQGGYGSVFGDMSHIKIDLCQHCAKELLGQWIRVFPEGTPSDEPPDRPASRTSGE